VDYARVPCSNEDLETMAAQIEDDGKSVVSEALVRKSKLRPSIADTSALLQYGWSDEHYLPPFR
jgi:hypothetical protein